MSHFAKIDSNNIVTEVIVAEQDFINSGAVGDSFNWVQMSIHGNFRGATGSIGMEYHKDIDKFLPVKPYASWVLNDSNMWVTPSEYPGNLSMDAPLTETYTWNEETQSWDEVTPEV